MFLDHRKPPCATAILNDASAPGARGTVDLSGDNELPGLLAEWEALQHTLKVIEASLDRTKKRIAEKIGDAKSAKLPGWRLKRVFRHQSGYSVPPRAYSYVAIKRMKRA